MSNAVQELVWNSVFGDRTWKAVASRMADHADEDGCGIWPSIERLAAQTELSERTVQRAISGMVEAKLLVIVEQGGHGRFSTTRYDFNLDAVRALPEAEWASKKDKQRRVPLAVKGDRVTPLDPVKGDNHDAKGDNHDSLGCQGDTQTTIEPQTEPSPQDAPAREAGQTAGEREDRSENGETRQQLEKRFWKLARVHPQSAGMPKAGWLGEWLKLEPDERDRAERRYPVWLAVLKANRKDHVPALSTYFAQKLFDEVDDPAPDTPPANVLAPWGKAWMADRIAELDRQERAGRAAWRPTAMQQAAIDAGKGALFDDNRRRAQFPAVWRMDERARAGQHHILPPGVNPPPHEHYVQIAVDSEEGQAWADWHAARDWPWIDPPAHVRFVWVPSRVPLTDEGAEAVMEDTSS